LSNNGNRMLIVLACAGMIVLMALLIFVTWSADTDAIDTLGDMVEYMEDHNDNAGKLIVTLTALIVVVLALLLIVLELAPEDQEKELKVRQEGATTIVPAAALRARIEEALIALPTVTAAKAKVNTKDNGIASSLEIVATPEANVGEVTQEASRIVNDTIQTDLGLPVAGQPKVKVSFGGPKPVSPTPSAATEPQPGAAAADSPPAEEPAPADAAAAAAAAETGQPPPPEAPAPSESQPPAWEQQPPSEPASASAPEAAPEPAPEAAADTGQAPAPEPPPEPAPEPPPEPAAEPASEAAADAASAPEPTPESPPAPTEETGTQSEGDTPGGGSDLPRDPWRQP
jgi:hypothetical protein